MDHHEYMRRAMETNLPTVGTHGRASFDFVHAVLGIITERVELEEAALKGDVQHIIEEHGDYCWFHADACQAIGHEFLMPMEPNEWRDTVLAEKRRDPFVLLADIAKSWFAYGKAPDFDRVAMLLRWAFAAARESAVIMDAANLDDAMRANLQKLQNKAKGRYKKGVTSDSAINRDTEAEKEAMIGATARVTHRGRVLNEEELQAVSGVMRRLFAGELSNDAYLSEMDQALGEMS